MRGGDRYQALSRPIPVRILERNLDDFRTLIKALLR